VLPAPFFGLWVLALGLGFFGRPPVSPPEHDSVAVSSRTSDEPTIRKLTEEYGVAISAGDLEAMRKFWDPQSPNLASRLSVYQSLFSRVRLDLIRLSVTRLEVTGDRAISQLTTDERQLDKLTGSVVTSRDAYHGACRSFEWAKTGVEWRIEREVLVQEELAAKLVAAASDLERNELLEREKAFVTEALVGTLVTSGQRHRMRGEYEPALHCEQLMLEVAARVGDQSGIAGAFLEIGLTKKMQDDYDQALLFEKRSLASFESAGQSRGAALVLENLSELYSLLGDYRQAFDSAQKSLRLYEQANHSRGTANALTELAHIYNDQNNFQQALAYVQRALAIFEKLEDKIHVAILRRAMADQYAGLGNYDRAREIYLEILKQTEGSGDLGGTTVIRNAISDTYAEQGRNAEAIETSRQALSTAETAGYKEGMLTALVQISRIHLAERDYAESLPPAQQATLLGRRLGRLNQMRAALTALGSSHLGMGHLGEAREAFTEAISILERLRVQTAGGIDESERFLESRLQPYYGMVSLLVQENQPAEALALAERSKARVLLDVLRKGRITFQKAMTAEEQQEEGRLKSGLNLLNRQMTRVSQSDSPDPLRLEEVTSRLEKARLDFEDFRTKLYSAHPELKIDRGEVPAISEAEIATLIPDGKTALLEYVVTDDRSYLIAVTRAGGKEDIDVQLHTLPISRAELRKQTEAFRQELAGRALDFRASSIKLYDLLLKPAHSQLRGKTNLIIVPDDNLWELPFQTLTTDAHRFVIEEAAIAYAPSLTVLREMIKRHTDRPAAAHRPTLLAVGNPTLGKETIERAQMTLRDEKLAPLPEAEQEVKALAKLYGAAQSRIYIGADASEYRIKRDAGQATILHFATHGTLNNAWPMYSHLVLAQGDGNDDGLLEAWEIAQLNLKADLVILSACETARGKYSAGEGMIGLSWAMFVAGVPTTVVSQWKVEAASTRDLLVRFHRALNWPSAGGPKATRAEGLREAELQLMNNPETSHPFYWAGFVLVGDGR
jgi:CHAT domain-containing protein/lipopolysaccharide biosynthesis regulator YciM